MDRVWISQLRKGLVELAVLGALRQREAYGYELLQRLATVDALTTTESTLYPLLARLMDEKLIAVRVVASNAGPPRRYYRITAAGEKKWAEMWVYWQTLTQALAGLMERDSSGAQP